MMLDLQVHAVELLPHLRRYRFPYRTRVFSRRAQARENRIWILGIECEKSNDAGFVGLAVLLAKGRGIPARVNQRLPLIGRLERQIELKMQIDSDEARDV